MSLVALSSAGLGEFRIRDLNDEINKLLREKGHWEYRINELGGPNYRVNIQDLIQHGCKPWRTSLTLCVRVCVCVCVRARVRAFCSGSGPGCWITRARKFQEIGGISILEQPEIYLESGNSLRKSVRMASPLPVSCYTITHEPLSDWTTTFMRPPAAPAPRKTRAELMKDVDAEYYGYRDEDDGVLLPLEAQYEKQGTSCLLGPRRWRSCCSRSCCSCVSAMAVLPAQSGRRSTSEVEE